MNIRYFLILIVAVSLSLSGCAYKSTEAGYNFEAQVVIKDKIPTIVVKCTPTELMREFRFTDDVITSILKKVAKVPDQTPPSDEGDTPDMTQFYMTYKQVKALMVRFQDPVLQGQVFDFLAEEAVSLGQATSLEDVLKSAIDNGSLACPPRKNRSQAGDNGTMLIPVLHN